MPNVRLGPSGPIVSVGASDILRWPLAFDVPEIQPGEVANALVSAPGITQEYAVQVTARSENLSDLLFEGLIVQAFPQSTGTIEIALTNTGAAPIAPASVMAWAFAVKVGD